MIDHLQLETNLMKPPCVQPACIHLDASQVEPISSVRITAVLRIQPLVEEYLFQLDLEATSVNDKNFEFNPSTGNQNNHNVAEAQGEGSAPRRLSNDHGPATETP